MNEYTNTAMKAALAAGNILKEKFRGSLKVEKKGQIDLVTDVDRESEDLINNIILSKYPDHNFIAEEGSESETRSDYLWLVDPLDGTTNFAHGFPFFCVSIALLKSRDVISACIYNPNFDECFVAEINNGAYLNNREISVSTTSKLTDSLLATGFPYDIRTTQDDNIKQFTAFAKNARAVRRPGSAALDLAYTACGRFDGFWEFKLKPWDIAAGTLIVKEAGGNASSWSGDKIDIFTGEIVASNNLIHQQMLNILKSII
jgi:myo-inositol-1(or 4)-monophosphatase